MDRRMFEIFDPRHLFRSHECIVSRDRSMLARGGRRRGLRQFERGSGRQKDQCEVHFYAITGEGLGRNRAMPTCSELKRILSGLAGR